MSVHLSDLYVYPVKSLGATRIAQAVVERMGLAGDRRLMVVDPEGMFLTQREHARMSLIKPVLSKDTLVFSAPGMETITVPVAQSGRQASVEIWSSSDIPAVDQGEAIAGWLTQFLNMPARLVTMRSGYQRQVDQKYATRGDDHVSFADGFPLLIISQESLDDLNTRLEHPVPMNRFRPNLVVSGAKPFAEDGWKRMRIGAVEMALVKPCARCNVPAIDQETGTVGREPNTTLAKFRKINGKVMFGVNVIPITTGEIRVGDPVEILE